MIINHNMSSMNTYNRLAINNKTSAKSLEKLSSGLRINRASDDAAGLAISEKMRAQVRGLDQASRNANDAISLMNTAEGALDTTTKILQRMRELAVQSATDTNTDADRSNIQDEVNQLISEIDRVGNTTEFNTKKLIDGSAKGVSEQIKGSAKIQNNSAISGTIAFSATELTGIGSAAVANGAISIIRISGAAGSAASAGEFNVVDTKGNVMTWTNAAGSNLVSAWNASTDTIVFGNAVVNGGASLVVGTAAASGINLMKVGESITVTFGKMEAAGTGLGNSIMAQIGANSGQNVFISMSDMRAKAIGVDAIKVDTKFGAMNSIETVNNAIERVSKQRSLIGAMTNRMEYTVDNLGTAAENLTSAESRVRDLDMAKEMTQYQKNNILVQAATSMLAQANQAPQNVLQLLR